MKRTILVCLLIFLTNVTVNAQTDSVQVKTPDSTAVKPAPAPVPTATPASQSSKRTFSEKFDVGIGTGFWINTRVTYIEVSPIIAYRFPKTLITGVGYRYIYRHDRFFDRDLNSYGPNLFARLNLTKRIYFWSEYEYLNTDYLTENADGETAYKSNENLHSCFVGLGYVRSFGRRGRGGISFQVLYNVLYEDNDNSPYYFPITYRVGYFF